MKKNLTKLLIIGLVAVLLSLNVACGSSSTSKNNSSTQKSTNKNNNSSKEESKDEIIIKSDSIENFDYEINEDRVLLNGVSYDYKGDTIEISKSYSIDGKEYLTDLSDFQVDGSSELKTVVFNEGITEINHSVFNGCDATKIYLPKSIGVVYDDCLSYLDYGKEKISIYYAGTEEEWNQVFQEYEAQSVSDAEWGEEKGVAIADKLNSMFGHGFNPDNFRFEFERSFKKS